MQVKFYVGLTSAFAYMALIPFKAIMITEIG